MHGVVYVDSDGSAVSPLYTWQDGRGGLPWSGGMSHAQALSKATGHRVAPGMGMATHHYNMVNKLVPRSAATFCSIYDYVGARLCGVGRPVTDATSAASFGCFDASSGGFDRKALERADLDCGMLPEVACGLAPVGKLRSTSIPVFPGLGDNQASFIGSVAEFDSSILVNVGTGSQVSVLVKDPLVVEGLEARPFPGGGRLLVGAPLCGGRAYAILRGFFDAASRFFTGNGLPADAYERMNSIDYDSLAEAGALKIRPTFAGTRADPLLRGAIENISADNLTPERLVAGLLEGVVDELRDFYELLPQTERSPRVSLVGSGNGVRRNPLLRRIFEKRFKMPLAMPTHEEEASLGAALLAGVGAGIFPDIPTASRSAVAYTSLG